MPGSLIVRAIVPAIAVLGLVGEPAWARGPACWNADELPAAQLYAFHTTLMVGALRCRSERPDVLDAYNALVEARKSSIDAARTVVQARFIRDLGAETGLTEFKNFDTEIANRASIAGSDGLPCDGVDTYSRLAASASQADLYTFARLNNPGVEIRSCASQSTAELVVPAQASQEIPDQARPATVMIRTGASPEAPEAVPDRLPAVVRVHKNDAMQSASQDPVDQEVATKGGDANADPAKALEDAARALSAAASSLRTASAANQ